MLQSLATLLFSAYRRRVLGLLLLHPERQLHVRDIARQTGTSAGTLHKELSRLAAAGLLRREQQGNQVYYSANRDCPIFEELAGILRKTSGLADVLMQALAPVAERVHVALVFGSMAKGTEQGGSDIDVMLVGRITFKDAVHLFHPLQPVLGREINAKVYSAAEWRAKVSAGDPFARDVLSKPKIFLIGNDHDLAELAGHKP
jgi:predicted nucleotidyltransferase